MVDIVVRPVAPEGVFSTRCRNKERNNHQPRQMGSNQGRKFGYGSNTRERACDKGGLCAGRRGSVAECAANGNGCQTLAINVCGRSGWFGCLPNCADPSDKYGNGHVHKHVNEAGYNCGAKADRL